MFRFTLFIVIVVSLIGGCGILLFQKVSSFSKTGSFSEETPRVGSIEIAKDTEIDQEQQLAEVKELVPLPSESQSPQEFWIPPLLREHQPVQSIEEPESVDPREESASYRFLNRRVPVFDASLNTSNTLQVLVDTSSNRWVFFGLPDDNEQVLALARSIDQPEDDLDLDFVLVSLSQEKIKSYGLTALFEEGVSSLSAAELGFDLFTGSLALGNISLNARWQDALSGSWVVSSPQIRTTFGERFDFTSGREVPVETVVSQDGVVSSSFEFREVGLSFSGDVSQVGSSIDARIEFSNSLVVEGTQANSAPTFQTQQATLRGSLEWFRWSLFAALKVDAESLKKGIFSKSTAKSNDLLLVFVRPRDRLYNSKALEVPEYFDFEVIGDVAHPLLPSK